ncbi:MAG: hypothetical protein ABIH48_02610 [Candidatus Falkowbacteria bacterium]
MKKLFQSLLKSLLYLFVKQTDDLPRQKMDPSGYIKCFCNERIFAGGRGVVECSKCEKKHYAYW